MHRGYIKFWRKTLDNHSLCSDPYAFTIFMHFLARAEWKEGRKIWDGKEEIVLKPGQLTYGRKELAKSTGISEEATRWATRRLNTTRVTTSRTTTKFTIVTILNWASYQQTEFETTTSNTHKEQPTNNQPTPTLKELKKERSIKNKAVGFQPPTLEEATSYFLTELKGTEEQAAKFYRFYGSKDWMIGKNRMKNWHMAAANSLDWGKQKQTNSNPFSEVK